MLRIVPWLGSQRSLLVGLRGPHGGTRIKPQSSSWKASLLYHVSSLDALFIFKMNLLFIELLCVIKLQSFFVIEF